MLLITLLKFIKVYVLIRKDYQGEVKIMTDTEEQEIDIDDIGTILKSSRLKSKISLEEISSELCIRKIYLTALEEGDYETLPPVPYGIGYVRTYARYLGLNPERAVQLYKTAAIGEEPKEVEEEVTPVPEVNKSNIWHIVAGFAILAIIYGGWSLYSAESEPKQDAIVDEEQIVVEENIDADENIADEATTTNATAEVNATTSDKTKDVKVETANKVQIDEKKEAFTASPDKVIFKFSGESWVEVKNKKKVFFQGVFHNGDIKEIKYEPNLFVSMGRPRNVTIYVKGEPKQIFSTKHKMNIALDSMK